MPTARCASPPRSTADLAAPAVDIEDDRRHRPRSPWRSPRTASCPISRNASSPPRCPSTARRRSSRCRARLRRSIPSGRWRSGAAARVLLAGPPGAGKTMTAAKLAARAVLAGGRVAARQRRCRARRRHRASSPPSPRSSDVPLDCVEDAADAPARGTRRRPGGASDHRHRRRQSLQRRRPRASSRRSSPPAAPSRCWCCRPAATRSIRSKWRTSSPITAARALVVTRLDVARRLGSIVAAADAARLAYRRGRTFAPPSPTGSAPSTLSSSPAFSSTRRKRRGGRRSKRRGRP